MQKQMYEQLHAIVHAIWEILLLIPLPWRIGLVLVFIVTVLFWIIWRIIPQILVRILHLLLYCAELILSLLLLPEDLLTKYFRRRGRQPLRSVLVLGDLLQGAFEFLGEGVKQLSKWIDIGQQWHLRKKWVAILAMAPIVIWYLRPFLGETTIAKSIDEGITWWHLLEGWALTGKWEPSPYAETLSHIRPTWTPSPTTSFGIRPTLAPTNTVRRARVVGVAPLPLRMRSEPRLDAPIIERIVEGTIIEIIGSDVSGEWRKIRTETREGWVNAKYLQDIP